MFSPQKLLAIITLALIAVTMSVQDTSAQGNSQYEARLQAMQNARARAKTQSVPRLSEQESSRVQQTTYQQGFDYSAPPAPPSDSATRMARAPRRSSTRVARRRVPPQTRRTTAGAPVVSANQYRPKHLRTAQIYDGQIISEGAPIISDAPLMAGSACSSCGGGGCASCGDVYSGVVEDVGCSDCIGCDDCSGCGSCGLEFSCADRGGCPPGTWENCWLGQIGTILRNGDYFLGATAFKGPAFTAPGLNQEFHDCNFGFYGGFNFGIPLCKLSCGVLSAQVGARSVQTNFNGSTFTPENRDQTFLTAGLYRRVDYGLQAGVVYDWLHEKWFSDSEVAQLRVDLGWVYTGGTTLGFRGAFNNSDDLSIGVLNDVNVTGLVTSTLDQYRFYGRRDCNCGGYTELFAGWADDDRTVLGFDWDVPVSNCFAVQAGLTYLIADDVTGVGGTDADIWNLYMGFHFRPRGLSWYRYYDRPMFNVADNGSMVQTR